jgi:hypothetical protein
MATDLQFYGINETLRYLKEYEKDLYKTLRKDLVAKAQPLAQLVGSRFPDQPLSNWLRTGERRGKARMPPYMVGKAKAGVKPISGTGSSRGKGQVILRIEQKNAGAQVYDSAGRGNYETSGSTFIKNLDTKSVIKSKRGKNRSRIMFGAVKGNQKMIEEDVIGVIKKVDAFTTKAINAGTGR